MRPYGGQVFGGKPHDLTPWHQYSLGVLVYAYREFESQVEALTSHTGVKGDTIKAVIDTFSSGRTFSIKELENLFPAVSRSTIRRVLNELRARGVVQSLGTGRAALWKRTQT